MTFIRKEDQNELLQPLATKLRNLVKLRYGSAYKAAKDLGWPDAAYVYRITRDKNFNYVWVTQLMNALGLSPNEAAALIGLYEDAPETLNSEERTLLDLFRQVPGSTHREAVLIALTGMLREYKKLYSDEGKAEEEGPYHDSSNEEFDSASL